EILGEIGKMGLSEEIGEQMLERLEASSLIEEADPCGLTPEQLSDYAEQIKFFSRFTAEGGAKHQAELLDSRVALAGRGPLAESLSRQLAKSGIGRISYLPTTGSAPETSGAGPNGSGDAHPDSVGAASYASETLGLHPETVLAEDDLEPVPDLLVVGQTAHEPELLEAAHVFSMKHDVPWLLVRAIDQLEAWVGPLFVPRDTASYASFEARLRGNMVSFDEYVDFDRFLRSEDGRASDVGAPLAFYDVISGIAVVEILKTLTKISVPALASKFVSIDLISLETEMHEILRFPRIEDEAYSRPGVFPWKELPYDVPETRRA
ncbi:MAG: hypothetical protein MI919_38300, partial [Holophagales bacterium]|nr:hypothetical protein [Holophagales bacterium]